MEEILQWLKKPSSKGDLLAAVVALWLLDSGKGQEGLESLQGSVRKLLGAAKDADGKADEPEAKAQAKAGAR